jgi:hypothetical protein
VGLEWETCNSKIKEGDEMKKRAMGVLVLLVCLAGCMGNRARLGSYVCTEPNGNSTKNFDIELKPEDVFTMSERDGSPAATGKYTIDRDKVTFTMTIWGTSRSFNGRFEGTILVLDDGVFNYTDMHFTKQN